GALAFLGGSLFIIMVYAEGAFGYREVQRMVMPALNLVRSIRLGDVVERMDIMIVSIWLLGAFVKSSLFVYLSSIQLAWVAGTRSFRPLALPIAGLGIVLALTIAENLERLVDFLTIGAFIPLSYAVTVALPLLILLIASARRA